MDFSELVHEIVRDEESLFIASATLFGIVAVITGGISKMVTNLSRERTKRDVAAYVAEGTMSPEQAQRLVDAGKATRNCS